MKNIRLLYENVREVKVNTKSKYIEINMYEDEISSRVLRNLAGRIKYLLKYMLMPYNIIIKFKKLFFKDKITYLILDLLVYSMIKGTNFNVAIEFENLDNENIHNDGFTGTSLYRVLKNNNWIDRKDFINKFESEYYADKVTYRRNLKRKDLDKPELPSIISSEIAIILKGIYDDEEWTDSISEVISELVDNVAFHTDSDCLVDINFSDSIISSESSDSFSMVNIAIINFSENPIFKGIKQNLINKKYREDDIVYKTVYTAYNNHKEYFSNDWYGENDFFLVTAFQNRVTTRSLESGNSGTGLSKLLQNIVGSAKDNYSYVLTGDNILFFRRGLLEVNSEKLIGFNEKNDYVNSIPDRASIGKSDMYIPGTIYNLLLIKEN